MRTEFKGFHTATLDGKPLTGWQIYSLPMSDLSMMKSSARRLCRHRPPRALTLRLRHLQPHLQ